MIAWMLAGTLLGCGTKTPPDAPAPANAAQRRAFSPFIEEQTNGIAYGPFREGQAPGGPHPTTAQIREDLRLLAKRFAMIRVYSAQAPTPTILEVIEQEALPLKVMVGAWIGVENPEANSREVDAAIDLANAHPESVIAVAVGNETQVDWSAHRSDRDALIRHLRRVRQHVRQPVTTADDYNFWNKPEADAVAAEVDFICLHAYAMWNGRPLDDAVAWTERVYTSIETRHPDHPVALCETGWATELDPEGSEVEHVRAPAGEAEQAEFYRALTGWAADAGVPTFYFEAFDEPWKGSDHPRGIEKHWGLYDVQRQPKQALQSSP